MAHHGEEFAFGLVRRHGGFLGANELLGLLLFLRDVDRRANGAESAAVIVSENYGVFSQVAHLLLHDDAEFLPVRLAGAQAMQETRLHALRSSGCT